MKALEWPQHYLLIFTRSRAANSEVSDENLSKFEPIQAFIWAFGSGELKMNYYFSKCDLLKTSWFDAKALNRHGPNMYNLNMVKYR